MSRISTTLITIMGLFLFTYETLAADNLVIISPHRKSIEQEFIPKFKEYYKTTFQSGVQVDWIDQGGTADDVRFVRAKFQSNPASSGIDIFWGGGADTFVDLSQSGLLLAYDLPTDLAKQIPQDVAGVAMYDKTKTWYASAASSFGIFYNKKVLAFEKIAAPQSWENLAEKQYFGLLTITDPRHSGTAKTMNVVMMQALGWDNGWGVLLGIHANAAKIAMTSSDPIKSVVTGDVAASPAIDFYANAKIGELGADSLGFQLPDGKTILDPDPVAILKGAPNPKVAERFVNYVLGVEAQKLLILPQNSPGGPKFSTLGRMGVNTLAYEQTEGLRSGSTNPFLLKGFMKLDVERSARMGRILNDLVGASMIDTHKELKTAWQHLIKSGGHADAIAKLGKAPITEVELFQMADKWDDNVFRNSQINKWVSEARIRYQKASLSH